VINSGKMRWVGVLNVWWEDRFILLFGEETWRKNPTWKSQA
jgi:hypothetical protein